MDVQGAYRFIQWAIIGIVVVGAMVLLGLSLGVRDVDMIVQRPFTFVVELILMSLVPGIPILYFVVSRDIPVKVALQWVLALSTKFGVIHVLFQTSGFYSYLFGA